MWQIKTWFKPHKWEACFILQANAENYVRNIKSVRKCFTSKETVRISSLVLLLIMSAKSFQSSPTLCDPMDYSLPGSSVYGILQARILECVAISSSRGSSQPRDQTHISCISCIADGFFTCWAIGEAPQNGIDDLICKAELEYGYQGGLGEWNELGDWHIYTIDMTLCIK